ncbi:MAG: hypothetical protein H7A24_03615 [Leptospiraceae bacterium]|nr:hypothetical protein [Leptospiraceae bacterium]
MKLFTLLFWVVLSSSSLPASSLIRCELEIELLSISDRIQPISFLVKKSFTDPKTQPSCQRQVNATKVSVLESIPENLKIGDRIRVEYIFEVSEEVGASEKVEHLRESKRYRFLRKKSFWDYFF